MSLAVAMARAIKVRVRSGDLAGGQLRPGAGHEILGRRRDMNLRALAQGMGVEMPAVVEGGGGRVVRPGDEDLTEIQRQREADQANRPEVGLRDILTNAGVTDEKLDGFKPAELFKILQPAGRAALVRAL